MRGTIPPLPNTPSWRGSHFKHRDNVTLPLEQQQIEMNFMMTSGEE
jgi:hypothetical protein